MDKRSRAEKRIICKKTKKLSFGIVFLLRGIMKKKAAWLSFVALAIVVLFACNIGLKQIYSLPDGFLASVEEIAEANSQKKFGSFVQAQMSTPEVATSTAGPNEGTIVFKLFGFIPIRKMRVVCSNEQQVYLGGVPIGIVLSTNGAIVMSERMVETDEGLVSTQKSVPLKEGDIVTHINGQQFSSLENLQEIVQESPDQNFEISFLRADKQRKALIKCEKDISGKNKLGLWVKDDVSGVGTLTYVGKNGGCFAALGHAITENQNSLQAKGGKVFQCQMLGVEKGEKNNPGQLRCTFLQNEQPKGEVERNTKYGVFGKLSNMEGLVDQNLTVSLGGRLSVCPGKAFIVSSVSGIREEYEIEIIKANYQSKANDKSIVFRVKDKRLIDLTGGIVQGMSGSPIIQNGKLVGAVTHVFMSDPTKGYGVYSDWMV